VLYGNPTPLTSLLDLFGYEKRPPPEPPPLEETKFPRACVCGSVVYTVLYCFYLFCIVCLGIVYFKSALMVFDVKPQRCLNVMKNILSKDLVVVVANQSLSFSTQQMNPPHVVSFIAFENPYSRSARPQVKEMIRNWIDLKTVVPQPTYHLWKKFTWVIGLSYWFGAALLASFMSKFIDTQLLVGLFVCVVFRMWMGNVQTHCASLCLYHFFLI
jgi:hypothetical protein